MKRIGNILKVSLAVLILLVLGIWIYVESHSPKLSGTVKLSKLTNQVDVYYDNYGIPHIYAGNAKDAYRAFGYVHAADRLFQMELMRRVGSGRLSEIFGPEMKKTDAFFRTIGTNRKAKEDASKFEELPEEVKTIFRAYIDGVNDYIAQGKIPIEYKLLRFDPEPYTVEDMYSVVGYMAYSFAYALRTDPLVEKLNQKLGYPYLKDFDMAYPKDSLWDSDFELDSNAVEFQGLSFFDNLPVPMLQGSNSWVVAPSRTLSGKVIFANDTHIKYASPSVWYEAHIEFPGFELYGNYMAGIPVALIGHSRSHAWGLTMFEDDDSDFFKEVFQNSDSSVTLSENGSFPVEKFRETIAVKGGEDTSITVYKTVHGTVINDFLPVKFDEPVSMYWNFTAIENQLVSAFHKMNTSKNIDEFRAAVEMVGSPGLNISYGDASGNIAIWSAGKLYERPKGEYGKLFLSGKKSAFSQYHPFTENPQFENPASGYLHSANQYPKQDSGKGIAGYYAPNSRYDRIGELLENMTEVTVDSMKVLITDVKSETAQSIGNEVAKVITASGRTLSKKEQEALNLLANWDGNHQLTDLEPTIYYNALYHILYMAMVDESGEEIFDALNTTHLMMRTYPKLIFRNESKWWDNVTTTDHVEGRSEIFAEAFKKSIAELQGELGDDINEWRWEKVHSTTHEHPMGQVDLLKPLLNVGPFPSPGGVETINNSGFTLNGKSENRTNFGPAMRIIIDFADIENAVSILPTGNSGNPLSPHYSDQAEMYIEGSFRKMLMNKKEIVSNSSLLEFKP